MSANYNKFITDHPNTQQNVALAPLSTLHVGGPADLYYELTDIEELPSLIESAARQKIPYFMLGGGSNIIFHEDGFRGLIIHMKAKKIEVEGETVIADAGALLSLVLQTAIKNGLIGMEKFMGLPGTVGGAVRGNAGAFGVETKDVVEKALIYNSEKGIHEVPNSYFNFKYRTSTVKLKKGADIVLRVYYKLKKGDTKAAMQENAAVIAQRLAKQPAGKNTGSFFKNPQPDKTAGQLLDAAGCKNLRVGDVQVSGQHANWIENLGQATQTQVKELMHQMQKKVKEKFDIDLEPEVQFVDPSPKLNQTSVGAPL